MTDQKDSLSYALGVLMGSSLKGQDMDLDQATFSAAFSAAIKGEELLMDEATANGFFQEYQQEQATVKSAANKKEGEDFLAENGKRSEVSTTASGLQYEVLVEGEGEMPLATDQVTVHYTGKLINGEVFDSSVDRGQPATFGLNQVIRGWTEGVQLMKEGAKYRFFIPSELAYGERGAGAQIGPGSTLIFDVELISINK
ncbi:MAG: FKBP-type peptidyl-prolyl cis-trans isomerase [Flavobacteriales bacterium]|nr:FKBP-type peptidyl-prolyl cis-trans isomerase [Flavobacteriales bacterium]NNK80022.1 FKBP-type peptidyl-prolyl cis-trans isomerase [Flavobacteriales bacterium]